MLAHQRTRVEYPTTDGRPLGETDVHSQQNTDLVEALSAYYRDRADVYVSGNLLLKLELHVVDNALRLLDPVSGRMLRTPGENAVALQEAEMALRSDQQRLLELETEVKRWHSEA